MTPRAAGLCTLTLIAATATPAAAQFIDTCGTLVQGPTCVLFQPDGQTVRYVLQPPAGGYFVGDRVRAQGLLESCVNVCLQPVCVVGAIVSLCNPPPTCRADFDGSGSLGVQDIFSFLAAYFANIAGPSPPGGDFDQNGSITVNDIFVFLAAYFTGCP